MAAKPNIVSVPKLRKARNEKRKGLDKFRHRFGTLDNTQQAYRLRNVGALAKRLAQEGADGQRRKQVGEFLKTFFKTNFHAKFTLPPARPDTGLTQVEHRSNTSHVLIIFGPLLDHFWIIFGPLLHQFWTIFGPFLDHFWPIFGSFLDHF